MRLANVEATGLTRMMCETREPEERPLRQEKGDLKGGWSPRPPHRERNRPVPETICREESQGFITHYRPP